MALRMRFHLPRRTVRLRLTALYGVLFLLSGTALLGTTYGLVTGRPMVESFGFQRAGGGEVKAVAVQPKTVAKELIAYSKCMRAHGVPNYPLPKVANGGRAIELSVLASNRDTPALEAASKVCAHDVRSVAPGVLLPPVAAGGLQVSAKGGGVNWAARPVPDATSIANGRLTPVTVSAALPTPQEKADWLAVEGLPSASWRSCPSGSVGSWPAGPSGPCGP